VPLEDWEPTKQTLHLYCQILGKLRMAHTAPRNHWWHVPLYISTRGLTTGPMHLAGIDFDVELDVVGHAAVARNHLGDATRVDLRDGLAVAEFWTGLHAALDGIGVRPEINPRPFDLPVATPFPQDTEHAAYDAAAVERWWTVLRWSRGVFEEFAGWSNGKSSPVHLFWHSFDLAVTRFSGRRASTRPGADPVTAEAYSHEVISFGLWPGDHRVPFPAYYSYAAPEPEGLADEPLQPAAAGWHGEAGQHMARLPYEDCRTAASPKEALLAFLQSAYEAGARRAHWDTADLASSWSPLPPHGGPTGPEDAWATAITC
jgi:hypothetical protein